MKIYIRHWFRTYKCFIEKVENNFFLFNTFYENRKQPIYTAYFSDYFDGLTHNFQQLRTIFLIYLESTIRFLDKFQFQHAFIRF